MSMLGWATSFLALSQVRCSAPPGSAALLFKLGAPWDWILYTMQ